MQICGERAALVVTRVVVGTSTTIARRRVELTCGLPAGHTGPHDDTAHGEQWEAPQGQIPTVLRHEEDEA